MFCPSSAKKGSEWLVLLTSGVWVTVGLSAEKEYLLLLAISEVPTKNLVIANKGQLFIIRLTESQLSLCDCQWEDRQRQSKSGTGEERVLSLSSERIFFPVRQGKGIKRLRQP